MLTTVLGLGSFALVLGAVGASPTVNTDAPAYATVSRGRVDAVYGPGVAFVLPLVSASYPVDPETMTVETGDGSLPVPPEYQPAVRRLVATEDPADAGGVEAA